MSQEPTTPATTLMDAACGEPSHDWEKTAHRLYDKGCQLECDLTTATADLATAKARVSEAERFSKFDRETCRMAVIEMEKQASALADTQRELKEAQAKLEAGDKLRAMLCEEMEGWTKAAVDEKARAESAEQQLSARTAELRAATLDREDVANKIDCLIGYVQHLMTRPLFPPGELAAVIQEAEEYVTALRAQPPAEPKEAT